MAYSAVELRQTEELSRKLDEIGKGAKPLGQWRPRVIPPVYRCVVEYARSNPYWKDKVIRPYREPVACAPASWVDECYQSAHRYGKTGPVWTGD